MAWFDSSKNRGYSTYSSTVPGYGGMGYSDNMHRPALVDSDGRKHPIVGYSHNFENYVAKTERVVEYRRVPANMTDHKYSPPRKEVYKDRGVGDKPLLVPRISDRDDRPKKPNEFSPKARDEVLVPGQSKNSPWNNGHRNNSPPSRGHDYGKHNNLNSRTNHKYVDSEDDEDDDDDDDVICIDGVCYRNTKEGSKPNYFKKEDYNENEKHKGNGYTPPTYTVPISTQPKRDTYYEPSHISNNNNDQKEKGNSNGPPRTFPFTTQPRKDTNYEASNNKPMATSPPQFNAPPKRDQGNQGTIDSTEARRRYGKATPGTRGHSEGNYTGTIDSKKAAEKYSGVFLPN